MSTMRTTLVLAGVLMSLPALAWQQAETTGTAVATASRATQAEAVDKANKGFDAMDDDHDGKVTESEMDRARAGNPNLGGVSSASELRAADTDGDRRITPEEQQAAARDQFKSSDANQDGRVDDAEMKAAERKNR